MEMVNILHTNWHVGLEKPVKILHITDVHLTEYTENDNEEQRILLEKRRALFKEEGHFAPHTQSEYFEEAIRMAEAEGMVLAVTGDVMDLNSEGNRKEFHRIADGHDMIYCPGGHEFQYRCHRPMDELYPYYELVRSQVETAFPEFNFNFSSRVVNGLNLIALDNGQDYFSAPILEHLEEEAAKGLPMLLFMHDPLNDVGLLRKRKKPDPNVRLTSADYKYSDKVMGFILSCPLVVGVIAGHSHELEEFTFGRVPCHVTPGLYGGICRIIEID